jgi:hypothetical protein
VRKVFGSESFDESGRVIFTTVSHYRPITINDYQS